jgi:hypothetical protein
LITFCHNIPRGASWMKDNFTLQKEAMVFIFAICKNHKFH